MSKFRKAVVAALGAAGAALVAGLTDGQISTADVATAITAGLVAGVAVYKVKNAK